MLCWPAPPAFFLTMPTHLMIVKQDQPPSAAAQGRAAQRRNSAALLHRHLRDPRASLIPGVHTYTQFIYSQFHPLLQLPLPSPFPHPSRASPLDEHLGSPPSSPSPAPYFCFHSHLSSLLISSLFFTLPLHENDRHRSGAAPAEANRSFARAKEPVAPIASFPALPGSRRAAPPQQQDIKEPNIATFHTR